MYSYRFISIYVYIFYVYIFSCTYEYIYIRSLGPLLMSLIHDKWHLSQVLKGMSVLAEQVAGRPAGRVAGVRGLPPVRHVHLRQHGHGRRHVRPPTHTLHPAPCALHPTHCTPHTAHCTLHTAHCTLHFAPCTSRLPPRFCRFRFTRTRD